MTEYWTRHIRKVCFHDKRLFQQFFTEKRSLYDTAEWPACGPTEIIVQSLGILKCLRGYIYNIYNHMYNMYNNIYIHFILLSTFQFSTLHHHHHHVNIFEGFI